MSVKSNNKSFLAAYGIKASAADDDDDNYQSVLPPRMFKEGNNALFEAKVERKKKKNENAKRHDEGGGDDAEGDAADDENDVCAEPYPLLDSCRVAKANYVISPHDSDTDGADDDDTSVPAPPTAGGTSPSSTSPSAGYDDVTPNDPNNGNNVGATRSSSSNSGSNVAPCSTACTGRRTSRHPARFRSFYTHPCNLCDRMLSSDAHDTSSPSIAALLVATRASKSPTGLVRKDPLPLKSTLFSVTKEKNDKDDAKSQFDAEAGSKQTGSNGCRFVSPPHERAVGVNGNGGNDPIGATNDSSAGLFSMNRYRRNE